MSSDQEAKAQERAERARMRAREKSEQAREQVSRALERAAKAEEQAQEHVARALERVERETGAAEERAAKAIERAERAGDAAAGREGTTASVWLRPEPRSRRPSHSRAEIAAAAVRIADAEGFEAVSMRRIAQELGAGTMTLYHYVRNKEELVTLMVDAVMGELALPEAELDGDWRSGLERIALRTRAVFQRHRWTLDRFGDGRPGPNGMRHFEQSLLAASKAGLEPEQTFEMISLLDDYVFGFALRDAQERDEQARGWPEDVREFLQNELDSGNYPLITRFLGADAAAGSELATELVFKEGRFERGLGRLLDGLEAELKKKKKVPAKKR